MTLLFLCSTAALPHAVAQVTGYVREAGSHVPIGEALVSRQAQETRTSTDDAGYFVLDVPDGPGVKIVGAAKGYFNASLVVTAPASNVVILLDRVPQDDDPTYQLMPPTTCSMCHYSQYQEWLGSPMNRAGINTWVDDLYSGLGTPGGSGGFVYARDSVFATSNPASECASCHQPERWIGTPFGPLADPTTPRTSDVLHGVSCEVCHKVADVDVSKINFPGIFPGAVTFTRPAAPAYHPVQYGRLGDVDYRHNSFMRASYQPQLAAEVCATCHQDASDPHLNHSYTGPISEPTYLEWIESPYGNPNSPLFASCVDCHMPPADYDTACEILFPPVLRDPNTLRSHRIEGTTAQYLENAVDLGITVDRDGPYLRVGANITNSSTGHHVPTGVTVRNMILLIEVRRTSDGRPLPFVSGSVVHELGGVGDPAEGYFAGLPGMLYAKLIEDFDGNAPTFFTDAAAIVFDSRIPALETDSTEYVFVAPGGGGEVRVQARLIYRRSFRALVDAKQWTHDGHGRPLADVLPPHFGHLMEEASRTVLIVPGDGDGNNAADLLDFASLAGCLLGPASVPPSEECLVFDWDADGDVDLNDFLGFQTAFGVP